ncbi:type II toxin-antitoxin system prevent-host-death family antitoxin [Modestobacter sp. I12A-02628]|uniref:Antitoxin n=1 Tax=Goekera deserti TaxID=2497753 RepID=A0A7K3WG17_9ACTN|nr:type II toxin-antitoxin system prevent-host-death family antitoxin [Goekera deserti]MPQ96460.1 type II toxin-antitoxin system prevent-host-death family antitoxin [Goekera deserti]NDI47225.1 type II toxin-antitoxin system prevent-host-death family antitoxin [Goekera deserti]NEL55374.1 type II toxin-antitoxin system prevent-host-death family antitoxin [Goekera deserti]
MTSVGIKELRDGLSRHLAAVRAGHTVTITDHGRPVARIVPIDQPTTLERLIAEGVVRPPRTPKRPAPEPLDVGVSLSDLVAEQRR